ncbi:DENN domain-containing protein 1B-like isoform X3 [Anneissia japonica]|uniref:DENN domain-containing protein 1B-like isoform X3 n=1 Tax=Anneissia japonica TaxID=1529436 RepID=UPI0014256C30|nr:DENN domain-containing protein 1B-like isoform X3 [Anneissia japonica]
MGSRLKENPEHIFECFFEVAAPKDTDSKPEIVSIYPLDFDDEGCKKELPRFCFPCDTSFTPAGQLFTFVLTDIESKQRFGFCRHPPGAKTCLCILSYLPWFEIFYKTLNTLGELHNKSQVDDVHLVLNELYKMDVPQPGSVLHMIEAEQLLDLHNLKVPDPNSLPKVPENRNITEYFNAVNPNIMMHIFASLLYERRVLITSRRLSLLTACIHGAAQLIYPLHWQHIFIPVMPPHLLDYCCAPMPYLIGVHSSLMQKVKKMPLDEVLVLDADINDFESPYNDLEKLSSDVVNQLKKNLRNNATQLGDGIARSFMKALVPIIGNYRAAIKQQDTSKFEFEEELFIKHSPTNMHTFLETLLHSQHFQEFIGDRLNDLNAKRGYNDIFEEEIRAASTEKEKNKMKDAFLNMKTDSRALINKVQKKANPAMKHMVQQTKDFAKTGVKEFKGMKTKLIKSKDDLDTGHSIQHLKISGPIPTRRSNPSSPSSSPNLRRTLKPTFVAGTNSQRPRTVAITPKDVMHKTNASDKIRSYRPIEFHDGFDDILGKDTLFSNKELNSILKKLDKDSTDSSSESSYADDEKKPTEVPIPMPRKKKINSFNQQGPGSNTSNESLKPGTLLQQSMLASQPPTAPPRRPKKATNGSIPTRSLSSNFVQSNTNKNACTSDSLIDISDWNSLDPVSKEITLRTSRSAEKLTAFADNFTDYNYTDVQGSETGVCNTSTENMLLEIFSEASKTAQLEPPVRQMRTNNSSPNLNTYSAPPVQTNPFALNVPPSPQINFTGIHEQHSPNTMSSFHQQYPCQTSGTTLLSLAGGQTNSGKRNSNPFQTSPTTKQSDPFEDLVSIQKSYVSSTCGKST